MNDYRKLEKFKRIQWKLFDPPLAGDVNRFFSADCECKVSWRFSVVDLVWPWSELTIKGSCGCVVSARLLSSFAV